MDWDAIEKAVYDWVVAATGLAAGQVIWERQAGPRPTGPWVGLRRTFSPRGRYWNDVVENPLVLADDDVESVDAGADTLTLTGHAYQTGDGPVHVRTTDTLPAGLLPLTDYWVVVSDPDTIQLAAAYASSVAGTPTAVDLTDGGAGTHTVFVATGAERAGEEITHTARGPGILTITMQGYGGDPTGTSSPEALLTKVRSRSTLPTIADALDNAGIGIASFTEVQPLDLSFGEATDVRALMTVTAHVADEETETGNYIATADLVDCVTGNRAPQTQSLRSFLHVWSADGDTDTVAIPGSGMASAGYEVHALVNTTPAGGAVALLAAPGASRTVASFTLDASGAMKAGTTIDIILVD